MRLASSTNELREVMVPRAYSTASCTLVKAKVLNILGHFSLKDGHRIGLSQQNCEVL
jgi:hypothetical protein